MCILDGQNHLFHTFFAYSLYAPIFLVPKLFTVVASKWIGKICVNLHYHLTNFKFRWRFGSIEGKDVGVGVSKLVIFSYCHLFLPLRLSLISSIVQEDSSEHFTTPRDVLIDLCGYALIFILRRVVIFSRSAYLFFVASTMRVLLWAVFTNLGTTLAERNLFIIKGESFVIGFSSADLRTINLKKGAATSFMLL